MKQVNNELKIGKLAGRKVFLPISFSFNFIIKNQKRYFVSEMVMKFVTLRIILTNFAKSETFIYNLTRENLSATNTSVKFFKPLWLQL